MDDEEVKDFESILNVFGSLGNEDDFLSLAEIELKKYTNFISIDKNRNLFAEILPRSTVKHLMIDAHFDQVCLIVTHICKGGFIKFLACGGIDCRVLPGKIVKFLSKANILGIICVMPPHVEEETSECASIEDLVIDTGLDEKAVQEKIPIGSRVVFFESAQKTINNNIISKSIDNRAGVMALILCAKLLSRRTLENLKVTFALSNGEEINALGAKTSSFYLNPDLSIAIDVSFASQPGIKKSNVGELYNGPMIGISPCLSRSISVNLIKLAKENKIPYQLEIMNGKTGTNADHITVTKTGIKVGLLSIPIRYMHTGSELGNTDDIMHCAKLLHKFIECNDKQ